MKNWMQKGATLLELVICIGVILIMMSSAIPHLGQTLAKNDLENTSRQLVSDLRWLQQLSINAGSGLSYSLLFNTREPYGYYIVANSEVVKHVMIPKSVILPGTYSPIRFSWSGVPLAGGQTLSLQSTILKTWKYVIVAPVTGRIRMSDFRPTQEEE